ncbi:MAG: hypothetical protein ACFFAU_12245 [Candidatus Hodarchaeota archaeon]
MNEILISILGFFALIIIAFLIYNWSATAISGVTINPYLFFDHQSVESSYSNRPSYNFSESLNIQITSDKSNMGIDKNVPIAESKWLDGVKVEQGSMKYYLDVPDNLPMHLTETDINSWILWVNVTGGYEPFEDNDYKTSSIKVYQKDREGTGTELVGVIKILWTRGTYYPSNTYLWNADFDIIWSKSDPNAEYISLDSSYYPLVSSDPLSPDDDWKLEDNLPDYIPRKEVDLKFKTWWSGCEQPDQSFLIISVRANYQFP